MKNIARIILCVVMLPFATISVFFTLGALAGAALCVIAEIDNTVTAALALFGCEVAWLLVLLLIFR